MVFISFMTYCRPNCRGTIEGNNTCSPKKKEEALTQIYLNF